MLRRKILSLFQQTIITPCAPVYNKMPKPCNGQCPACGTMNDPIENFRISGGEESAGLFVTRSQEQVVCGYCANTFAQWTVPKEAIHK